jgi:hypothetical protein
LIFVWLAANNVVARSEATKQSNLRAVAMDCFAEPVIGRRFAPTRWARNDDLD